MKKIFVILLLSLNLFSLANAESSTWVISDSLSWITEETSTWVVVDTDSNTWVVLEVNSATSSWTNVLVSPVENLSYTYYFGQTCPYCQQFSKYMDSVWGFDKLNIEKREVWHNKENSLKFAEDLKRLWLENNANIWVPFLVINDNWTETYLSWLDQLMAHFEPILWKAKVEEKKVITKEQKDRNVTIFIFVMILLAVILPSVFISISNRKK